MGGLHLQLDLLTDALHCCSVLYYVRSHKHIEALWFANTANALLWWTYVKAFWRALNSVFGEKIQFKTTLKGAHSATPETFCVIAAVCTREPFVPSASHHVALACC